MENLYYDGATGPKCPWCKGADMSQDGFVGQNDLDIVLSCWGHIDDWNSSCWEYFPNGFVGQNDLDIILGSWGESQCTATGWPEEDEETEKTMSYASSIEDKRVKKEKKSKKEKKVGYPESL